MEKPYPGKLRWQPAGSGIQLRLRGKVPGLALVSNVIFVGFLLTDNPWSRVFRPFLLWQKPAPDIFSYIFTTLFWASILLTTSQYLWLLLSQEELIIDSAGVQVRRYWLGMRLYQRRVPLADVQLVRIEEPSATTSAHSFRAMWREASFANGTIQLETPEEQIAFGRSLDPAEARAALLELRKIGLLPRSAANT